MATITFKAKAADVWDPTGERVAYRAIKVPTLTTKHCDMAAFRSHPKYGSYANSDLFPGMLARIKRDRLGDVIHADSPPEGVTVDTSGYLARVTLEV